MMKLLTVMLLSSLFVGANFEAVAGDPYDTNVPEVDQFESKANIERAYKTLKEKFNIDTYFKFKQEALNYILAGVSRDIYGAYFLVTKDTVYDNNWENSWISKLGENCVIVKDEPNLTILQCKEYGNEYSYFEYENTCKSGKCTSIDKKYFFSSSAKYEEAKTNHRGVSGSSLSSKMPLTHEEWLRYHAEDEEDPNGYFTKRYKEEFGKEIKKNEIKK